MILPPHQKQGQRNDLKLVQNFAQVNEDTGRKNIEIAAEKSGFGNKEAYRQAKKVVETATNRVNVKIIQSLLKLFLASPTHQLSHFLMSDLFQCVCSGTPFRYFALVFH